MFSLAYVYWRDLRQNTSEYTWLAIIRKSSHRGVSVHNYIRTGLGRSNIGLGLIVLFVAPVALTSLVLAVVALVRRITGKK